MVEMVVFIMCFACFFCRMKMMMSKYAGDIGRCLDELYLA